MLRLHTKKIASLLPPNIGVKLSKIPFPLRLGSAYKAYRNLISNYNNFSNYEKRADIFSSIRKSIYYAVETIPFYSQFYKQKGFDPISVHSFKSISEIPIITKEDLQKWPIEKRTISGKKGIITNTGGTSGQPLGLVLDVKAYAREWAHMHTIWDQLNYKTSSIKLTVRGMNLGSEPIKYNFIHNEFQINAYCDINHVFKNLKRIADKYTIEYLHGYPSGLHEFSKELYQSDADLFFKIKSKLKGVFLCSEYPAPIYRNTIEEYWEKPTLSWYGHTEMAVLAYEKYEPFVYHPFHTYGFVEAVKIDGRYHLVGTTYHNEIGPLIRYDTGDIIEPISYRDGLLESFKISEGRIGEFVTDSNGRKISLTALIFGRHHELFQTADFLQVKQDRPGEMTVFVTTSNGDIDPARLFDSSGINMNFKFEKITKPFKTKASKVPLLLKDYITEREVYETSNPDS